MTSSLFALAAGLNALVALALVGVVVRLVAASSGGLSSAGGSPEFAVGMFTTIFGVVLGMMALFFAAVAWFSWRRYCRFALPADGKDVVALVVGFVPVTMLILFTLVRFIPH